MADDSLELFYAPYFNSQRSCPHSMTAYGPHILSTRQQTKLSSGKFREARINQKYLGKHPEVRAIITLILRSLFVNHPVNISEFVGEFINRKEFPDEIAQFVLVEMKVVTDEEPCEDKTSKEESGEALVSDAAHEVEVASEQSFGLLVGQGDHGFLRKLLAYGTLDHQGARKYRTAHKVFSDACKPSDSASSQPEHKQEDGAEEDGEQEVGEEEDEDYGSTAETIVTEESSDDDDWDVAADMQKKEDTRLMFAMYARNFGFSQSQSMESGISDERRAYLTQLRADLLAAELRAAELVAEELEETVTEYSVVSGDDLASTVDGSMYSEDVSQSFASSQASNEPAEHPEDGSGVV